MLKFISADFIVPIVGEPIKDGIVSIDESGKIINLFESGSLDIHTNEVEKHQGIITPGFVNAHCHLELSHLHNKFPKHTGLISFIEQVIQQREADESVVNQAMIDADKLMIKNGIVAVGDISNNNRSKVIKENSAIYYHTFIEVLGFSPQNAGQVFESAVKLKHEFGNNSSVVPHAPYSVSRELLKRIKGLCEDTGNLMTIHNQECDAENEFYRYKTGSFVAFYKRMQQDISYFKPQARNSIQTLLPAFIDNQKILLVHNTCTSYKDINFAGRFNKEIIWCFCPNANLYIENRLPKIELFLNSAFDITIGTDSLASNNSLCILSELSVILNHFSSVSLLSGLKWATLNGAKFLGIEEQFGSIEPGKTPGLNLITNIHRMSLTNKSKVVKLV